MQVMLDQPYNDLSHMEIWAGEYSNLPSTSGFLTVFASTTSNFTATGTVCVRNTAITSETSGVVTCPPVAGTRYVSQTSPACIPAWCLNAPESGRTSRFSYICCCGN